MDHAEQGARSLPAHHAGLNFINLVMNVSSFAIISTECFSLELSGQTSRNKVLEKIAKKYFRDKQK